MTLEISAKIGAMPLRSRKQESKEYATCLLHLFSFRNYVIGLI